MRGADVGAGCHHGEVGRDHEDEACRGGTRARRSDEDDDRGPSRDDPADNGSSGVEEAAGGAKREDDDRRACRVRAIDHLPHELGGDRMDDAIHLRHHHERPCPLG